MAQIANLMAMTFWGAVATIAAVLSTVVNTRRFVRAVKRIRQRRLQRQYANSGDHQPPE